MTETIRRPLLLPKTGEEGLKTESVKERAGDGGDNIATYRTIATREHTKKKVCFRRIHINIKNTKKGCGLYNIVKAIILRGNMIAFTV